MVAACLFWTGLASASLASACLLTRTWLRVIFAVPFGVLAGLLPLLVLVSMVAGGPFASYELLDSATFSHSVVRAYRTNGGATEPFGICVVQEMMVLPGVVLARDLEEREPASDATVRPTGPSSVVVTIHGEEKQYSIRPFVYF